MIKNEILLNLDFTNPGICVQCIKRKHTKHTSKKRATRSTQPLEIIYTDISGPYNVPTFGGEKHFITFIDEFSRYSYIYLLYEKSQLVNSLEAFFNKVERQLDINVKIIKSNISGDIMRNILKMYLP